MKYRLDRKHALYAVLAALLAVVIAIPVSSASPGLFVSDLIAVISGDDNLPKFIAGENGLPGAKDGWMWLYDYERRDAGLYVSAGELYCFGEGGDTKLLSTDAETPDSVTTSGDISVGGNLTVTGTTEFGDEISSSTDWITITDSLYISDNLKVGDGTPSTTLNGEDAYIEGTLEADGAVNFDSSLNVQGSVVFQNDVSVDDKLNLDELLVTVGGDGEDVPGSSLWGTFIHYTCTQNVTRTFSVAGGTAGDLLLVTNISTYTLVIEDDAAIAGSGNRSLGENDIVGYIFSNDVWVEMFYKDNS
jgi:hypothetical protein